MGLAELTYELTATRPRDQRAALCSQPQRAAVSVRASIAEGHERRSARKHGRFPAIAAGSTAEPETHLQLGIRIGISEKSQTSAVLDHCRKIGRIVQGIARGLGRATEP